MPATDPRRQRKKRTWGGARPGAGRPRRGRENVPHRKRPPHAWYYPSQVTIPFVREVGSLRKELVYNILRRILLRPKVAGFQVVEHTVQKDHLHLIVEAANRRVFSSGMRSLSIRIARRLNSLFGRRGKVVRDRYHRRDLFTAAQVRTSLVYVLLNGAKHKQIAWGQLDPFSSAATFSGWVAGVVLPKATADPKAAGFPRATGDPPLRAKTPLLESWWQDYGLISPDESIRWAPPLGPVPPEERPIRPSSRGN